MAVRKEKGGVGVHGEDEEKGGEGRKGKKGRENNLYLPRTPLQASYSLR